MARRPTTWICTSRKSIPSWAVIGTADRVIPPAELTFMARLRCGRIDSRLASWQVNAMRIPCRPRASGPHWSGHCG